jgi:hypothetical protein
MSGDNSEKNIAIIDRNAARDNSTFISLRSEAIAAEAIDYPAAWGDECYTSVAAGIQVVVGRTN